MSSNQTEANPIPITTEAPSGHDEVDRHTNFLNLKCDISNDTKKLPKASLNDTALRERLIAVLIQCRSALHQTKHLTDNYIKQFWGKNISVQSHHDTWAHKTIPWLTPDNKPIPIKFRGEIHELHLNELMTTQWTQEKIFEYLGKIYQRFQRIGVGIQIVQKWNELASLDKNTYSMMSVEQQNTSTKLFSLACAGVHEVLCQIQGIFLDMAIDPSRDLDITPFILDKFIKLNHWLVYREYENLMDYSHKLLKIITGDKKHIVK